MGVPETTERYTVAEYLEIEGASELRMEYHNGKVLPRTGATMAHSGITVNMISILSRELWETNCGVFESNLKIHIEAANSFVYPDVSVFCGPIETYSQRKDIAKNPALVVEVLSENTASFDRGGKFHKYQLIPSLKEYLLVEQSEPQVDVFYRNDAGEWMVKSYFGMEAVISLPALGVQLHARDIYRMVEFPTVTL